MAIHNHHKPAIYCVVYPATQAQGLQYISGTLVGIPTVQKGKTAAGVTEDSINTYSHPLSI